MHMFTTANCPSQCPHIAMTEDIMLGAWSASVDIPQIAQPMTLQPMYIHKVGVAAATSHSVAGR